MSSPGSLAALQAEFGIGDAAQVMAGQGGLPKIQIDAGGSAAEIYLHGAQVTSWKPASADEVLFLSGQSQWQTGRAIRGGVPICFPWFRNKGDDASAPSHGFARTREWRLVSVEEGEAAVVVTLAMESDDATQRWWPHGFRMLHRVTVGKALKMELVVTNTDAAAWTFEEALHSYLRVGAVEQVRVRGLDGVRYQDNVDGNREKRQEGEVRFGGATDNAYLETRSALTVADPVLARQVRTEKAGSATTVVWNPWESGAKAMADLGNEEWREFVCVEATNIRGAAVTLQPGETQGMAATISVAPLG